MEGKMKKVLMLSIVFLFFVGIINTQGVRDDDSYFIYFSWTDDYPNVTPPGGYVFYDEDDPSILTMTAVRTNRGFNVYAMNNSPDAETGARVVDHSAYPDWYSNPAYDWDVPDADASWSNGTRYLITLDTFQQKWWLFYIDYPFSHPKGVFDIYVPMSGTITGVELNDGTVDIQLIEAGGDWKTYWVWGFDEVKLQDRNFVVHLDLVAKTGYMAPKQLLR